MRPETIVPLTLEEHRELGREIKLTCARMRELHQLVSGIYGPANQAVFSFTKALECLEQLQADLEAQAAADLPGYAVSGFYE